MSNLLPLCTEMDRITAAFEENFGHLTAEQLNWKAHPTAWSVAQNIEHLIVINETYYPIIEALRAGTYQVFWLGKIGFMVRFFGKFILDSVQPYRRKQQKIKTFPIWEPSQSAIGADILQRFTKHQEELKKLIIHSENMADQVISSPANKIIVYRLSTAFEIMVAHEKRHLEQAREVEYPK